MQLASRRPELWAMRLTIDHAAARAADPFAAIAIELDRILVGLDQVFVDEVEHFQKGHVGRNILGFVSIKPTSGGGTRLSPNDESKIHL
jgi:hypothetical protein